MNKAILRDNDFDDCPSHDYTPGEPSGTCWSDGHYLCVGCVYYRADFKKHGQKYIDAMHNRQSWEILTINNNGTITKRYAGLI